MRETSSRSNISVRAISGCHVVVLAIDMKPAALPELLGFAIERRKFDSAGQVVEKKWLRGIKRFEDKDKGLKPGTPVPSSEHPIQSFQWGDYTVDPKTKYAYRIVPARGAPKNLRLDEAGSTEVSITTEANYGDVHSVFSTVASPGHKLMHANSPILRRTPMPPTLHK